MEEKSPFIKQTPVSLSPSWEARQLPNDELNLRDITKTKIKMALKPPSDKWKIVFLIFVLHGLGTLMPWNMFITAKDYFVCFKLGGCPGISAINGTTESNGTATLDNHTPSNYAANFLQYIGFASQVPNVVFNWLNIFINVKGDLTKRIVYSIMVEIVIFTVTIILAMCDSSAWPGAFFWLTMISVVLMNIANGIYQNTIYGMAATLPPKYTGAVVLGSNMSGLFTSLISIFSEYIFSSQRTSAIYYFLTAMFVLLVAFDTYFALPLNKFYRYEMSNQKKTEKQSSTTAESVPYWSVFSQALPQLFNVFFTFFITLAVFPAVHSDISPNDKDFIIPGKFFVSITCFLTFNLFAMLGSLTTSWVQWPGPKYLVIAVVARVVFIPLFLFCNYNPKGVTRVLPIYITNDWVYWIIAVIMSYSSGYLSSLGMMYAPNTVALKHQITAGMFAAAMLITGIFSGILFSLVFPILVANISF